MKFKTSTRIRPPIDFKRKCRENVVLHEIDENSQSSLRPAAAEAAAKPLAGRRGSRENRHQDVESCKCHFFVILFDRKNILIECHFRFYLMEKSFLIIF